MLKKKIAGNWHKIDIWEKENCIVAYKSGGIILQALAEKKHQRYIPFYHFKNFSIQDDILYILAKNNTVYQLENVNSRMRISETTLHDPGEKIDLKDLELIEDVRAYDFSNDIIACAYKQKGICFFNRKTKCLIHHFDFPGYSFIDDIKLYGQKVYIADVFGLRILDISDIADPKLDDANIYKGWAKDIAVRDDFLFVADVLGVKIFDGSRDFKLVGKIETNKNRVAKVIVKKNLAFLSCEARGLKIIDIGDVSNPRLISGLLLPHGAWDVFEYEEHLYIASYTDGLIKVFFKDINRLKTVGRFCDNNEVIGVYVDKRAVFAACSYQGAKILDHNLNVKAEIKIEDGRCWTLLARKTNLFAACGKAGVMIYDISDIDKPVLIESIPSNDSRDLVVKDHVLYVADGQNGVEIYDIQDIHSRKKLKNIPSAAFTRGVMVDDAFIYKADGDGGVEIYEAD